MRRSDLEKHQKYVMIFGSDDGDSSQGSGGGNSGCFTVFIIVNVVLLIFNILKAFLG